MITQDIELGYPKKLMTDYYHGAWGLYEDRLIIVVNEWSYIDMTTYEIVQTSDNIYYTPCVVEVAFTQTNNVQPVLCKNLQVGEVVVYDKGVYLRYENGIYMSTVNLLCPNPNEDRLPSGWYFRHNIHLTITPLMTEED